MSSRNLAALAAIFVLCLSGTAFAEPYELRGIPLGISLTKFRAMPYPDAAETEGKLICTGDPAQATIYDLSVHGDEEAAGVLHCGYFYRDEGSPIETWYDAGLKVATVHAFATYDFLPDPATGEPRLYQIMIRSNVSNWSKFWEGLTQKFGKPNSIDESPTQNQAGASFDNIQATWDNKESSILALKRFNRIDNTYIFYTHTKLSAAIKDLVQKKTGKPADNM